MQITNRNRVVAAASLLAVLYASGCAPDRPAAVNFGAASSAGGDNETAASAVASRVPERVVNVLRRDRITVDDDSFAGGLSRKESLERFEEMYGAAPSNSGARPAAYAVRLRSSQETRLPAGSPARVVHLPGVEQQVTAPWHPDEDKSSAPQTITTDMFAFFDATTGDHLATIYIGPPG